MHFSGSPQHRFSVSKRKTLWDYALIGIDSMPLSLLTVVFSGLKNKPRFTQIDSASGVHQMSIAEKNKHKTAFRGADGQSCEFNRAGFWFNRPSISIH